MRLLLIKTKKNEIMKVIRFPKVRKLKAFVEKATQRFKTCRKEDVNVDFEFQEYY